MPITKEHREFFLLDLETGWETPSGYPLGIEQKILSSSLDEDKQDRKPDATPAHPCRRLHHRAFRPRLLGRGLSALGRSNRRQRRGRPGRRAVRALHLCRSPSGCESWPLQVRDGLHGSGDSLLRSLVIKTDGHAISGELQRTSIRSLRIRLV